ncbi:hypothetical protein HGRIS_007726 [Hohenbuehelia grisea]
MLTFLELYQTLLGFVFFKLYTDVGLAYPPPLDAKMDEGAAGVGAFSLQPAVRADAPVASKAKVVEIDGKKVSGKDVRQTIKNITASSKCASMDVDEPEADASGPADEVDEEFVPQPSSTDPSTSTSLPTLQSLTSLPQTLSTSLFSPYTFFLSRETSRPIFEFLVRSFGGRIGWPASSGSGSPFDETDDSITHVIIDRPVVERTNESPEERERRLRRKYVQPQWVVDCINAGKILLEGTYEQGKTLPPHLSPFGEYEGAYDPLAGQDDEAAAEEEASESGESADEDDAMDAESAEPDAGKLALQAAADAAATVDDPAVLRAAEIAAEAAGVDFTTFEKQVKKSQKKAKSKVVDSAVEDAEKDMNKMMMSNKQKKLYEKVKHSQNKKAAERATLEDRKKAIQKQKQRDARSKS